jgi:hypothetical protein
MRRDWRRTSVTTAGGIMSASRWRRNGRHVRAIDICEAVQEAEGRGTMSIKGCDLCGDFPAQLRARCHPTAPLRVEMTSATDIALYCYLPECDREVARFALRISPKPPQENLVDGTAECPAQLRGIVEQGRPVQMKTFEMLVEADLANEAEAEEGQI